ncbi:hypothetical protein G6F31_016110 [Rhizopus arrhizus]|nr:hypothetical protein G6F31_016110 [Rhizopus arrhizus]
MEVILTGEMLSAEHAYSFGLVNRLTEPGGALAGALITPLSSVDPNMGLPWLVSAFMLVMVSGHSITALLLTCLVYGACQVLVSIFVSPILGGVTIAVLAALTLRLRGLRAGLALAARPGTAVAGSHVPRPYRGRPLAVRHLLAQRADQGAVFCDGGGDGGCAVGLHRPSDVRPVCLFWRGRLCRRPGLHALWVFAWYRCAGRIGGSGYRGAACAGDGVAVVLSGGVAILRDGHLAGAAHRADAAGVGRRHIYRVVVRPDGLRDVRPVS